ncbi:MAG TPA: pseudouridine synthase [Terracidiphilus sp.]|nr:pseudouridine synthase [Terracidiphilus sp.]
MTDEQNPELDGPETDPGQENAEAAASEQEPNEAPARPEAHLERLQKILAQAGIASRRAAEQVILEGRVQVNGQIVTELGTKADPERDHIRVDGKLLHGAERLRYFMLNKPRGYVTTVKDPEGRPTVMEFFAKTGERLYPVGRLDYLSEGLLLVTNDGPLANALTRAASGVKKTYLVKVAGQPTPEMIEQLQSGVAIDRGRRGEGRVQTAPARIRQVRPGDNPWFEVVLIEGRNRELRKMFEEVGHHVEKIRRVGYGPLVLDVEPGNMRELEPDEVEALRLTAAGKLKPRPIKASRMLPKDAGLTSEQRMAKAEKGGKFKRGSRPPERGGRPGGHGFKPSFKPKSEFGSGQKFTGRPGFAPRSASGPASGLASGPSSGPGSATDSTPRSTPGSATGSGYGSSFKSGFKSGFKARPRREDAPDRRRTSAGSGVERPFRSDRPTRPGKPFGKPAFGEGARRSGKPFDKPAFGEGSQRPPRPEGGRSREESSRPFKTAGKPAFAGREKSFGKAPGKPAFGERGKSFGKSPGKPAFGERGKSFGKSSGKPAFGERGKSFGKSSGKPAFGDRGKSQGKSYGKPASGGGRGRPQGKPYSGPGRGKGPSRPGGKPKGR